MSGEEYSLDIRNRNIRINRDDFKSNKKEKFLYDYITKNDNGIFSLIDVEPDSGGIITQSEIRKFLQNKTFQKKNITEEDLINFFQKIQKLNPTYLEKSIENIQASYKDENGDGILSKEVQEIFGLEKNEYFRDKITDKDNNINKGFEIFDLNGDKKLDEHEERFMAKNGIVFQLSPEGVKRYLSAIDNLATRDGIISAKDKQKIYDMMIAEYSAKVHQNLKSIETKDNNGRPIVTDSVKNVFGDGKTDISPDDVVDSNGNIKQGLEIFDLNGDKKFDDTEKKYFINGGHPVNDEGSTINLKKFITVIEQIDAFSCDNKGVGGYCKNGVITESDKQKLYKILDSAYYMLDNIKNLPSEVQQYYVDALKVVNFGDFNRFDASGAEFKNTISINTKELNNDEVSTILIHELTHLVLSKMSNMDALTQEVETFYMEYKLYESLSEKPGFFKRNSNFHNKIDKYYISTIEKLKQNNPEMSEKEIALAAFFKHHYTSYKGNRGYSSMTEDEMKEVDYFPMGDIFK